VAKRTIGFEDYTPNTYEEYTGEAPPANQWFTGEVVRATYLPEDDQVRFIIELVDHPDYSGWGKGWYAPFEGNQKWKMQELLKAIQGGLEKAVSLDWEVQAQIDAFLKKGKRIRFQTELYNEDIKIKKVRPLLNATAAVGAGKATTKAAPAPAAVVAVTDDEIANEEALEDYTEEELGELEISELLEILTDEFEVEADSLPEAPTKPRRDPDGSKMAALEAAYIDKLVDAILDAQEEDSDETGPEGESTDDPDFEDGFDANNDSEPDPEPEPEPAKPARRSRAKAAAPAAEPEPAAAPARTRRARR
jgi:hypothetical protein